MDIFFILEIAFNVTLIVYQQVMDVNAPVVMMDIILIIINVSVKCNSTCKTCSDSISCLTCIDNYFFLSNQCYECNKNCKTTEDDNCRCENCFEGYYLYNYQCLKCDSKCKTCEDTSNKLLNM